MNEIIEFLKKDRRVNETFKAKLAKVGIKIHYGRFSYWDQQDFVEIGRERVWLVKEVYSGNNSGIEYRYQNDVIEEIIEAIASEKKRAEESDRVVNNFFEKLGLAD